MSELQQIEISMKEAKDTMALRDALTRLQKNRDFKKVILEGFFEQEAIRLVHLKADPAMADEPNQKAVLEAIDAIGNFRGYLARIQHAGRLADQSLHDLDDARSEILSESLAE